MDMDKQKLIQQKQLEYDRQRMERENCYQSTLNKAKEEQSQLNGERIRQESLAHIARMKAHPEDFFDRCETCDEWMTNCRC